ncbi:BgTH12-01465 [Blumeria graminis f. sp. triticale]|nr:BgTH12-01465 [Blumeria graminis f. sp. triticale]
MARKLRFHGLKKPKIRASWNKYNLYNLSRMRLPNTSFMTYFQQKWSAKSLARAYHGDKIIREKQWQRMFSPNMNAVIPVDHRYLAEFDGSELAEGRGSGKEVRPKLNDEPSAPIKKQIPYMNMTFAPLERRLDMAIFRSLFASSHKQARQMVVHGHVKVNGLKMAHPGYLLNPGDMYQVETDVVQHATGDRLNKEERQLRKGFLRRTKKARSRKSEHYSAYLQKDVLAAPKSGTHNDEPRKRRYWLKKMQNLWTYITKNFSTYQPTRKIKYRQLRSNIEKLVANWYEMPWKEVDNAMKKVAIEFRGARFRFPNESPDRQEWLLRRLAIDRKRNAEKRQRKLERLYPKLRAKEEKKRGPKAALQKYPDLPKHESRPALPAPPPLTATIPKLNKKYMTPAGINIYMSYIERLPIMTKRPYEGYIYKLSHKRLKRIKNVGVSIDSGSKSYPTPWRPRKFMSAFAFIPRYLEVRQSICAGVYLRHPVARPGLSEVPSPYPMEIMQLAYNWYLRRR